MAEAYQQKGDLISRSKVIDVLKETGIIADDDRGHLAVQEIERIPVAYDVEKVVEQIKSLKGYKQYPITFSYILEIARKGGVE